MASEKQIAANRLNAQKSSGPRTPTGKSSSSRNSLAFGLRAAKFYVLPWENRKELLEFARALYDDFAPVGVREEDLVLGMIQNRFTVLRADRAEASVLHFGTVGGDLRLYKDLLNSTEEMALELELLKKARATDNGHASEPGPVQPEPRIERVAKTFGDQKPGPTAATADETLSCELESLFVEVPARGSEKVDGIGGTFARNVQVLDAIRRYRVSAESSYWRKDTALQRLQAARRGEAVSPPESLDVTISPHALELMKQIEE